MARVGDCIFKAKRKDRHMNILFYQHQFPAIGGMETVTATLANAFTAEGHRVSILSHRSAETIGESARVCQGVTVFHMPGEEFLSARNTAFLQSTIKNYQIDLIIFQDSYAPIEKNLFTGELAVPVVVCEHNSPFRVKSYECSSQNPIRRLLGCLKFSLLREHRYRKDGARRRYLYERSECYVLLSTRFFGEFRAVTRLADTRKLMAIPNPYPGGSHILPNEKRNEVIFVATLAPWKGCDLLLEAWRRICCQRLDWQLTIVGDGPERQKLEKMANEYGLKNVSFEGYRSDPTPYFGRAKILAFPSRFEGWGLVLIEAMAKGCVPVAFDSYSSVHDIVQDNVNGIIVPAFDVAAYAVELLRLMQTPSRWELLQSHALITPQKFKTEVIVSRWKILLRAFQRGRTLI